MNHNTDKAQMTFLPCYTINDVEYLLKMTEFVLYETFLLAFAIAVFEAREGGEQEMKRSSIQCRVDDSRAHCRSSLCYVI